MHPGVASHDDEFPAVNPVIQSTLGSMAQESATAATGAVYTHPVVSSHDDESPAQTKFGSVAQDSATAATGAVYTHVPPAPVHVASVPSLVTAAHAASEPSEEAHDSATAATGAVYTHPVVS